MNSKPRLLPVAALLFSVLAATALAQGTGFTYQGRLMNGTNPASGAYEITFTLYDAATNGAVVGSQTIAPVPVTNGLFSTTLDFGATAFNGAPRWLEIAVNIFGSDMVPTTIRPRQPVTSAPYALHAATAGSFTGNLLSAPTNQAMELFVNNMRVLRLEPSSYGTPNFIAGSSNNSVDAGIGGAVVFGGGSGDFPVNSVGAPFSTIAGGSGSRIDAGADHSTIAGGLENRIETNSYYSFIGGGFGNVIYPGATGSSVLAGEGNVIGGDASLAAIGGGGGNAASGYGATVGGGGCVDADDTAMGNIAGADWSTIGGGRRNFAWSFRSTIAGGSGNTISEGALAGTIGGGDNNFVGPRSYEATIGGGGFNVISGDAYGATIAGGYGGVILSNSFTATIGGGYANVISTNARTSTIAGGYYNTIGTGSESAAIAGGSGNSIGDGAFYSFIGGGNDNVVGPGATVATIGGGEENAIGTNASISTIAGGEDNKIGDGSIYTSIGGGYFNIVASNAAYSVIAGGRENEVRQGGGSIGGGRSNRTDGVYSTVAGGFVNSATGAYASIPGGWNNVSAGRSSFAAGQGARSLHDGAFVWADGTVSNGATVPFSSMAANEFSARATGGARFASAVASDGTITAGVTLPPGAGSWSSLSDRSAKEDFAPANAREILEKVAALPLTTWSYKAQPKTVRHIGPMAQDFREAFGVGENERSIATVDADGVALAAIQGLNQKLEVENAALRSELRTRDAKLEDLQKRLVAIEERIRRTQ